jgi:hypothetical protein
MIEAYENLINSLESDRHLFSHSYKAVIRFVQYRIYFKINKEIALKYWLKSF